MINIKFAINAYEKIIANKSKFEINRININKVINI